MRILDFSGCALKSCVAVALFAGCGGSQSQPPIGPPGSAGAPSYSYHRTFDHTGKQRFQIQLPETEMSPTGSTRRAQARAGRFATRAFQPGRPSASNRSNGVQPVKRRSAPSPSLAISIAAFLAGCGGSQPPIGAPGAMPLQPSTTSARATRRKIFDYTGGMQTFKVPVRVTRVTVTASGASGGLAGGSGASAVGGLVKATIPVVTGESLAIVVGGAGSEYGAGYNGGGYGGISRSCSGSCSGGGGGASDVREGGTSLENRVVVAGGGGGQACCFDSPAGGVGGGIKGGNGVNGANEGNRHTGATGGKGGKGGDQAHGGRGGKGGTGFYKYCAGTQGTDGTLGDGGQGGPSCNAYSGGGGGGGYYGGGGGGGGCGYCGESGSTHTYGPAAVAAVPLTSKAAPP